MIPVDERERILQELGRLAEQNDEAVKKQRKEIWARLLRAFGRADERDLTNFLASELELQPITIKRWLSGEFNPRHIYLLRMRPLLGLPLLGINSVSEPPPGMAADAPVAFDGALAAIRTFSHFFYCLQFAKRAFSFKGNLAYHAGRAGATRQAVISILQARSQRPDPLIMYYFYAENLEAGDTLRRFLASPHVQAASVTQYIRPFAIQRSEDRLGLFFSSVSPLLLVYDSDGQKLFDKFVDVFFEVPVEFVQKDNRPVEEHSLKTMLIQQPEPEALKFSVAIVEFLRELKNSDSRFDALESIDLDEIARLQPQ